MSVLNGVYREKETDFVFAEPQGPVLSRVDNVTKSLLYEQRYWQRAVNFRRAEWSSGGPFGSYLVEESPTRDIQGGHVEWTRTFAAVPPTRTEYSDVSHAYQFIIDGDTPDLGEVAFTVKMATTFTYAHTTDDPSTVFGTLAQAFRYFKLGSKIYWIGIIPGNGAQTLFHEDETFRRWRANIWEKTTKTVPFINFNTSS